MFQIRLLNQLCQHIFARASLLWLCCICVCVCARERERMCVSEWVCMFANLLCKQIIMVDISLLGTEDVKNNNIIIVELKKMISTKIVFILCVVFLSKRTIREKKNTFLKAFVVFFNFCLFCNTLSICDWNFSTFHIKG